MNVCVIARGAYISAMVLGGATVIHAGGTDIDGDGFDDLVVGSPKDAVNGINDAGSINIIYGSAGKLKAAGDQYLSEGTPGIAGALEESDLFGYSIVTGDFNSDGFNDVAAGLPNQDVNGVDDAGAVVVLYGSAQNVLTAGDQTWHRGVAGVQGEPVAFASFGSAMAVGDFDGDGLDDLAIGASSDDVDGINIAGSVQVLYGSSNGLTATGDQFFSQNTAGILDSCELGDAFGTSLAAGDFDDDGRDDLAIGVPGEDLGAFNVGAVHVLYGSNNGLTASGDQIWTQDTPGIQDSSESGDGFGYSLATGDFDGDSRDDLAIGVGFEHLGPIMDVGAVAILYGSADGLRAQGDQFWHQDSPGVQGSAAQFSSFGQALGVGDFDGDGFEDLAIGIHWADSAGSSKSGAFTILFGGNNGLTASGDQLLSKATPGVAGSPGLFDQFGCAFYVGDFDSDGFDDLGVCAAFEGAGPVVQAGTVTVFYGSPSGLRVQGEQVWSQATAGIGGEPEDLDAFGARITRILD